MLRTSGTGRCAGFTLLELMVVMAILVMIATLFPVALDRTLPSRRVSAGCEQLVSTIHEAEGSSLLSGKTITLALQDHELLTRDASTGISLGRALPFAAATRIRLTDQQGRPLSRLLLYPDGSAQAGRFELEDDSHQGAVAISPLTGRVSIIPGR